MQQTLENRGWFAAARCPGILCYHYRTLGKIVAWILGVSLGGGLLMLLLPLIIPDMEMTMQVMISPNVGQTIFFTLICACITAGRSTRFLLRFGTPRFSVWLCNLLSLIGWMFALVLGSLAVTTLLAYLSLPLNQNAPEVIQWWDGMQTFQYNADYLARTLSRVFSDLPRQLLWVAEYCAIFYLLGCCLRRSKKITLTVIIGLPMAFIMLMVVPAAQDALQIAMSGDQAEIARAGLQWMTWLMDALRFMEKEWPAIQLGIAAAALPLSYLCMRGTKQP